MKHEFSRQIKKKTLKFKISWKSLQWDPSCSLRADRQTDMKNRIVAFRNFLNAPKSVTTEIKPIMLALPLFSVLQELHQRKGPNFSEFLRRSVLAVLC